MATPDWVALVEQANRERVVTNLYAAFQRAWLAGRARRTICATIWRWSTRPTPTQNRAIRQQALETAAILNRAGAAFAFLKGANWLLEMAGGSDRRALAGRYRSGDGARRLDHRARGDRSRRLSPGDRSGDLRRHFHHVPLARPGDRGHHRASPPSRLAASSADHRRGGRRGEALRQAASLPLCQPGASIHLWLPACPVAEHGIRRGPFQPARSLRHPVSRGNPGRAELDWRGHRRLCPGARHLPPISPPRCISAHRLLGLAIPQPFADSAARAPAMRAAACCSIVEICGRG